MQPIYLYKLHFKNISWDENAGQLRLLFVCQYETQLQGSGNVPEFALSLVIQPALYIIAPITHTSINPKA